MESKVKYRGGKTYVDCLKKAVCYIRGVLVIRGALGETHSLESNKICE